MRKLFTILATFLLVSISALSAQNLTVDVSDESVCANTATVRVFLPTNQPLVSFQFTLDWNPSELTYSSHIQTMPSGTYTINTSQTGSGKLLVSWGIANPNGINPPANGSILEVVFNIVSPGGPYPVLMGNSPTPIEFGGPGFSTYNVTTLPGSVTSANSTPEITCPGNITTGTTSGQCSANVTWPLPTVVDCNNSPSQIALTWTAPGATPASGSGNTVTANFPVGTTTVTYTATDPANLSDQCSFTVTVNDTQGPVLTCPSNVIASAGPGNTPVAVPNNLASTATDNCPGNVTKTYTLTGATTGSGSGNVPQSTVFQVGVTTVTYTAVDAAGNSSTCSFTVTINTNNSAANGVTAATVNVNCCPGASSIINVPVTLNNAEATLYSIQFSFLFDPAHLIFQGYANAPAGSNVNVFATNGNQLNIAIAASPNPFNISAGGTVIILQFQITGCTQNTNYTLSPNNAFNNVYANSLSGMDLALSVTGGGINIGSGSGPATITCPANVSVACGNSTLPAATGTATAVDACGVATAVTYTDAPSTPVICGTITRTWRVVAQPSVTCTQIITVTDAVAPTLSGVPANVTVACNNIPPVATVTANDNCATNLTPAFTQTTNTGSCPGNYTITRTWSVSDGCGNTTTQSQIITVQDNVAPTFTVPANVTIQCNQNENNLSLTGDVTDEGDNCQTSGLNATFTDQTSGNACNLVIARTWSLTDVCGNTTTKVQTITKIDNTDPTFTVPGTVTVACDQINNLNIAGQPTNVQDNCDQTPTVTRTDVVSSGSVPCNYQITRTWTVTDDCGNDATATQIINVVDQTAPTFTVPANVAIACDQDINNLTLTGDVTDEADNCQVSGLNATYTDVVNGSGCSQTVTRTWTLTDQCNNTTTKVQTITRTDNVAPTFNAPANITVACGSSIDPSVTGQPTNVSDNCDLTPTVLSPVDQQNGSGCSYSITRTWQVTDDCNNVTTKTQIISVVDGQAPTAVCGNITVNLNASGQATINASQLNNGSSDICTPAAQLAFTSNVTSFDCSDLGPNTVVLTVTDLCGNTAACTSIVTVVDDVDPSISCPANVVVTAPQNANSVLVSNIDPVSLNDNCNSNLTVTYTLTGATTTNGPVNGNASGVSFNLGTTTVTYIVTDASGNTASCQFQVTVNGPVQIQCPANVTLNASAGNCSAVLASAPLTITQGQNMVLSQSWSAPGATPASGTGNLSNVTFPVGMTTVTYTVTTSTGPVACSFQVLVNDTQVPTITCPAPVTVNASNGLCTAPVSLAPATLSDNCGTPSMAYTITGATTGNGSGNPSGVLFNTGTSTITLIATDASGNSATCTVQVTVTDTQAPVISNCPADITVNANPPGSGSATVNNIGITATDNCGTPSITWTAPGANPASGTGNASGTVFSLGATTVTYTVTDVNGNSRTCTFKVTVEDQVLSIVCPGNKNVGTDAGKCSAVVAGLDPVVSIPGATLTYTLSGQTSGSGTGSASGQTFNPGITTVTYTATANNQTKTCSFTVTVTDNEDPKLTCPSNVVVTAAQGQTSVVVNNIAPVASDNCVLSLVAYSITGVTTGNGLNNASGTAFNIGTSTVTYTAADAQGNDATCTFTVNVNPPASPDLIDCPNDRNLQANANCTSTVIQIGPRIKQGATIDSILWKATGALTASGRNDASGTVFPLGLTTITYTAYGPGGIVDVCTFTVNVRDLTAPVITCPAPRTLYPATNTCAAPLAIALATATDNCSTPVVTMSPAMGTVLNVGTSNVVFTATDAAGNSSTCTVQVTVADTIKPTVVCPGIDDVLIEPIAGTCDAKVTYSATGSDLCSAVTLSYSPASGSVFGPGITNVTVTATDGSGNTATCTFPVSIQDLIAPTILNCPTIPTVVNADPNTCTSPIAALASLSATDNCGNANLSIVIQVENTTTGEIISNPTATTQFEIGTWEVAYVVTDAAGNNASCTFVVEIVDASAPLVDCFTDVVIRADGTPVTDPSGFIQTPERLQNCELRLFFNTPSSTDCSLVNLSLGGSPVSGDVFKTDRVYQFDYLFEDTNGNTTTCAFKLTVLPFDGPQIEPIQDNRFCEGESFLLLADGNVAGNYAWSGPGASGIAGNQKALQVLNVPLTANGLFRMSFKDNFGCASKDSVNIIVDAKPSITADGSDIACQGNGQLSAMVNASSPAVNNWSWSGPCGYSSTAQNPNVTGLTDQCDGLFTVTATTAAGCTITQQVTLNVLSIPAPSLDSRCDDVLCQGDDCLLMGTNFAPVPDRYQWFSNRPGVDGIQSGTLGNEILVSPTDTGVFVYSYFVTIQGCNSDTSTISLRVAGKPVANDDQYTIQLNKSLDNFDIRTNDQFFSTLNRTITITQRPVNGILLRNNDGTYSYTPNKGFIGTDEFKYTICYDCNSTLCDEAIVFINVEFEGGCVVPTIITPNKDGINDALQILCLETGQYPQNELTIYNQWGDEVFRAQPYTNNWDGTLKGDKSKDLPDGTYYYLLKLTPTDTFRKGFITVFR